MPSGYTAGILNGEIQTFKEFTLLCMRNFGATIHMRDEPLNVPFKMREPSDYHKKAITKAKKEIKNHTTISDEELIANEKSRIIEEKEYHLKAIEENNINRKKLNQLLTEVNDFIPPTPDHQGLKSFMASQIAETIKFDCNNDYHEKAIAGLEDILLEAPIIRERIISDALRDLKYHTKEYEEELKRCESSNQWVKALYDSFEELERKSTTE